jgi:hypothetical protein
MIRIADLVIFTQFARIWIREDFFYGSRIRHLPVFMRLSDVPVPVIFRIRVLIGSGTGMLSHIKMFFNCYWYLLLKTESSKKSGRLVMYRYCFFLYRIRVPGSGMKTFFFFTDPDPGSKIRECPDPKHWDFAV